MFDPWLRAMSDAELAALKERLAALGMTPIVSWGLMMGPFESALRSARALGAKTIRCGLTTVLCGDRAALGDRLARAGRRACARRSRQYGPARRRRRA